MGEGVVGLGVGRLGVAGLVAVQVFAPGRTSKARLAGTQTGLPGLPGGSLGLVCDDVDPHPHIRQPLQHGLSEANSHALLSHLG